MLIIKKNEKSYRNKILKKFKNFSFKKKLYRNLALCFSSALLLGSTFIPIRRIIPPTSSLKILLNRGLDDLIPVEIAKSINGWIDYGDSLGNIFIRYIRSNLQDDKSNDLKINITQKNYLKLLKLRNKAVSDKILTRTENDEIKGSITYKGKSYPIELRLKGDWVDHLKGLKWSFRVKVKKQKSIFGMRKFSLQHPSTRNYMNEFIYHKMLKNEGVPSLRYRFANLSINGRDFGTYAVEEHFDKILIENNEYREGPIIKLSEENLWLRRKEEYKLRGNINAQDRNYGINESYLDTFNKNKMNVNINKKSQYFLAKDLLNSFLNKNAEVKDVFDVDLLAKYFAISDLLSADHGYIWHNLRFYYNPVTGRLAPIGFDAIPPTYLNPNKIGGNNLSIDFNPLSLFDDDYFLEKYLKELERVSNKKYLDDFLNLSREEFHKALLKINKTYPFVLFLENNLYKSQLYIKSRLNPIKPIISGEIFAPGEKKSIKIKLGNSSQLPIEIINLSYKGTLFFPKAENNLYQKNSFKRISYSEFIFDESTLSNAKSDLNKNKIIIKYRIKGLRSEVNQEIFPLQFTESLNTKNLIVNKKSNLENFNFIEVNHGRKTIKIKNGTWNLEEPFITPKGYKLIVRGDSKINIFRDGLILSQGPIDFQGENQQYIKITGFDGGRGILVINAVEDSKIKNVLFSDLSAIKNTSLGLTGAISFYNSPVEIKNAKFFNTNSEDSLNLFRSKFKLGNVEFKDTKSDALDIDFSDGNLKNISFINIGNDAVDISGSKVAAKNINISKAADKALSAGEGSSIYFEDSFIENASIGIASKDLSEVYYFNSKMNNVDLCMTAYQKKPEFGPGLIVSDKGFSNCKENYLLEPDSIIKINSKQISPNTLNVSEKLYGNYYGKASER